MNRALPLLAMACVAVPGCVPEGMRGTIDGAEVPIVDTFFSEHPEAISPRAGFVFVFGSSLPEGCRTYLTWEERRRGVTDPHALAEAWAQTFPTEFWEALVVLRVNDPAREIPPMNLPALDWYAAPEDLYDTYLRVTHHTDHRDAAWFSGGDDPGTEEFLSHRGFLEVHKHVPGSRIRGAFETRLIAPGSRRVRGAVELVFDGKLCPGVIGL